MALEHGRPEKMLKGNEPKIEVCLPANLVDKAERLGINVEVVAEKALTELIRGQYVK